MTRIIITFWNAGGLSAAKFAVNKNIMRKYPSDVFGIVDMLALKTSSSIQLMDTICTS